MYEGPGSRSRGRSTCNRCLGGCISTFVADMHDQLVLQQLLNCLEGLPALQIANAGNQLGCHVLMVPHSHLDGRQDAKLLPGNEMHILFQLRRTVGSRRM